MGTKNIRSSARHLRVELFVLEVVKPSVMTIPILQGTTKKITRTRLGTAFKEIIDKCNENYREQMATVKLQMTSDGDSRREPKTSQQLYEMAVLENRLDKHSRLPIPLGADSILCWAFNGYDFKLVQPCLCCQRFYGK